MFYASPRMNIAKFPSKSRCNFNVNGNNNSSEIEIENKYYFQHIIYQFLKFINFNNPSKIDLPKGTELIDCQVNIKSTLLDNSIKIPKAVENIGKSNNINNKNRSHNNNGNRISKNILIEEVANDYRRAIRENFDMEINIKEVNQLNQIMAEDLIKN
ncbi:hypothetical protein ACTA71_009672 [Dictyostelium dimigraforme]